MEKQTIYMRKELWTSCPHCGYLTNGGGYPLAGGPRIEAHEFEKLSHLKRFLKHSEKKGYWCPICDKELFF